MKSPMFKMWQPVTLDCRWIVTQVTWIEPESFWFYSISIPCLTQERMYSEEDLAEWVQDYNSGVFDPHPFGEYL